MYKQEFEKLVRIMKQLRKECPWDRAQSAESLRQYILEETYETIEAIDNQNWEELRRELGDLLLQIVFQAEIAEEKGRFTLKDVIENINHKLIERHPHVFGEVMVKNADEVKDNWEQIKIKTENRNSILEGLPKNMSALLLAQRIQDKASHVGFDWKNPRDVVEKVEEEIRELKESMNAENLPEINYEIGDLFFSIVNLCRFYKINAEDSLRQASNKFVTRFQSMEKKLSELKTPIRDASLEEMDKLWEEVKKETDNRK
jgi:MazG family protein